MDVPLLIAVNAEDDSGKENAKESRRKKTGEAMRGIGQGNAKTIITKSIPTDKIYDAGGRLAAQGKNHCCSYGQ